jgi:hypothetical protein
MIDIVGIETVDRLVERFGHVFGTHRRDRVQATGRRRDR